MVVDALSADERLHEVDLPAPEVGVSLRQERDGIGFLQGALSLGLVGTTVDTGYEFGKKKGDGNGRSGGREGSTVFFCCSSFLLLRVLSPLVGWFRPCVVVRTVRVCMFVWLTTQRAPFRFFCLIHPFGTVKKKSILYDIDIYLYVIRSTSYVLSFFLWNHPRWCAYLLPKGVDWRLENR